MGDIVVGEVRKLEAADGRVALVGEIQEPGRRFQMRFTWPGEMEDSLHEGPEPFLAATVMPALLRGWGLRSELPASPSVVRGLHRVQGVFASWYPDELRPTTISVPVAESRFAPPPRKMASFFSLGVDSFDTAITHTQAPAPWNPPLTHLVLMRGLELPLAQSAGLEAVEGVAREVASELRLSLLVGETDMRSHYDLSWERHYHGAGLAATALTLARGFSTFLIPSSVTPARAEPWGSMPMIEESCSTEWFRITTDASETSRAEKIVRSISRSPLALRHLRVCTVNQGGIGNCGRCQKCLRTMLLLEACGALRHAATFPNQLPDDFWKIYQPNRTSSLKTSLRLAKSIGGRALELVPHLERAILRQSRREALRQYLEVSPIRGALPVIRKLRRLLKAPQG